MNVNLVFGSVVAAAGFLLMLGLVFYNRKIVEDIYKKNITHIREIKSELGKNNKLE